MKNIKTDETISAIYKFEKKKKISIPLIGNRIPAGFPSPAQDYIETTLDLNEFLITHPASTFFIKVQGYSMINAGIFPEDILIVDRAIEAKDNDIIIAVYDGELTIKRLKIRNNRWYLVPENSDFEEIEINEDTDFQVWGIVTYAIHKIK